MKKFFLILCLTSYILCLYSQKEDYNWVMGNGTLNQVSFLSTSYSIDTFTPNPSIRIHKTNASISDSLGDLLLFSGGAAIYNAQGSIIQNGDSINFGYAWQSWVGLGAYGTINGALFLPSINDFILVHLRGDSLQNSGLGLVDGIFYSAINKIDNNNYIVEKKNIELVLDTLTNTGIAACKQANGRDWWLMASEGGSSCYYTLLYNPDTIVQVHKQCIGIKSIYADGGQSLFSPDGSLFVRGSIVDGVEIFDFDRCSGLLSNPRNIPLSALELSITNLAVGAVAISPNNKFLYLISSARILQYDLESSNIIASQILIHDSDTAAVQNYGFATAQIAPNGEIFISAGVQAKIHIIHNPNKEGVACNLEVSIPLPQGGSYGLPNFPNYRLGALTGSPCDTLTDTTINVINRAELEENLSLFPNPSSSKIRIEYGNFHWSSLDVLSLKITNYLGQEVLVIDLPAYSLYQDLDVSVYPKGIYLVNLYNQGNLVGVRKFVKE